MCSVAAEHGRDLGAAELVERRLADGPAKRLELKPVVSPGGVFEGPAVDVLELVAVEYFGDGATLLIAEQCRKGVQVVT